MPDDKMPIEVTGMRVSRRLVALAGVVGASILAGEMTVSDGAPWWWVPVAAVAIVVIWWAIYGLVIIMEARARMDGKEDWADIAWRKFRVALTRSRHSQVAPESDDEEKE